MLSPAANRRLRIFSRAGYVIVILLATLTHLRVDPDPARVAMRARRALHWALRGSDIVDAARNVALFAGFGVVWLVTSPPDHPWRRVARITLLGFLLSVAVEAVQLLSASRTSSINDVATNSAGAFVGAAVLVVLVEILRRVRPARSYIGFPLYPIAGAYALAVATDIFAPFYGRERIYGPGGSIYDRLVYALQFVRGPTPRAISLFDLVAVSPAGFLVVVALAELGMSFGAACALTVAGGAALSVALEIAHGIAGQRIQVGAMISHTVAISLGAVIAWRAAPPALRRIDGRRALAAILLVASAGLLAVWSWRPFVPQLDLASVGELSFEAPDPATFACLRLALEAGRAGGTAPCVLNAADEVAVAAFLGGRIPFTGIAAVLEAVLGEMPPQPVRHFDDLFDADAEARRRSEEQVRGLTPA